MGINSKILFLLLAFFSRPTLANQVAGGDQQTEALANKLTELSKEKAQEQQEEDAKKLREMADTLMKQAQAFRDAAAANAAGQSHAGGGGGGGGGGGEEKGAGATPPPPQAQQAQQKNDSNQAAAKTPETPTANTNTAQKVEPTDTKSADVAKLEQLVSQEQKNLAAVSQNPQTSTSSNTETTNATLKAIDDKNRADLKAVQDQAATVASLKKQQVEAGAALRAKEDAELDQKYQVAARSAPPRQGAMGSVSFGRGLASEESESDSPSILKTQIQKKNSRLVSSLAGSSVSLGTARPLTNALQSPSRLLVYELESAKPLIGGSTPSRRLVMER